MILRYDWKIKLSIEKAYLALNFIVKSLSDLIFTEAIFLVNSLYGLSALFELNQ